MAYFMVCHYALFFGGYNRALALVTGNNNLNAFLKVLLNDRVAPQLYRAQSRFVYNVGKLGTGSSGCVGEKRRSAAAPMRSMCAPTAMPRCRRYCRQRPPDRKSVV